MVLIDALNLIESFIKYSLCIYDELWKCQKTKQKYNHFFEPSTVPISVMMASRDCQEIV